MHIVIIMHGYIIVLFFMLDYLIIQQGGLFKNGLYMYVVKETVAIYFSALATASTSQSKMKVVKPNRKYSFRRSRRTIEY